MRNSFSNSGVSNSQGECQSGGPGSRTITGTRLGGEHWWFLV